ncbi:MAG: hypothetical protein HZA90_24610 [Verrucomicrobia bacterium]|nr:hypothetical protein [Verrucomicrobiota bacterium]
MQTIEMFEIITQTQPEDYQSLEILKEAYSKLNREEDLVRTSRRIAQAYVQLGQLSSAILEYESILQRRPEDPEVLAALADIETTANTVTSMPAIAAEPEPPPKLVPAEPTPLVMPGKAPVPQEVDDGRQTMFKLFVDSKVITAGDFDLCWQHAINGAAGKVIDPFVQALADRGTVPIDKSMKILCEKSRLAYLPIDRYDVDFDLIRSFPADVCRRWCVLPFDRMSKSVLVATANPYNRQAAKELEVAAKARLLWYLSPPQDIMRALKKAFR